MFCKDFVIDHQYRKMNIYGRALRPETVLVEGMS